MRFGGHWRRTCVISLALALGSLGCRHRGGQWRAELEPVADAELELLVIGQPRDGRATRLVARELDRRLAAAADAGRTPVVFWLGSDLGPRGPERSGACGRPNLAELAEVVDRAVESGASSFGLAGPDAWRCGQHGFEAAAAPLPYQQPGVAYLVRVLADGRVVLASRCAEDRCEIDPPDGEAATVVELVALDLSYWVYPELADAALTAAALGQQRSLLAALAADPAPPRILISPIPIESAGTHGLGGRKQRASFRYLPEFVQEAIAAGTFVGAIGALERDLQLSEDLSNAIIRGDRTFISKPIFAVVSGAAGGSSHTLPTSRGGALLPDAWSEHPGFARLLIHQDTADVRLHARVAGRWRETGVQLPLDPPPLPGLREPPTIQPCPSCDPQAGAADGEVFVPRTERPR